MRGLRRASPLGTALGQGVLDAAQRTERFQGAHREHGTVTAWRWHLRAIHKGAMELPVALPIGANSRGQWLWSDAMGCHGHSQLWALLLGTKKERDIHWELKQQPISRSFGSSQKAPSSECMSGDQGQKQRHRGCCWVHHEPTVHSRALGLIESPGLCQLPAPSRAFFTLNL